MKNILPKTDNILFWLPRILAILFIGFLATSAFDVFEPGKPLLYMIGAFLIHLIPVFLLSAILFIAWKRGEIGGLLFLLSFIFFFVMFWDRSYIWLQFLLFNPLLLIGGLFLLHNYLEKTKRKI